MPQARKKKQEPAEKVSPPPVPPRGTLLRRLGVFGLDHLEAIVVAALATEAPILLVGPHGTAKSRLLLRLGEALGLACRHYNASLLSFDDLVGYPLPDDSGELRFVRTPASIWDAQVVFLDEISRCRPDVQNRVFSIIHERRVQGIGLPKLRHRWAAMNPPALDDSDGRDDYLGAEPLDIALADRFPFVVAMPSWDALSAGEQEAVILAVDAGDDPVERDAAEDLRRAVADARERAAVLHELLSPQAAGYVRLLMPLLADIGLPVSPRRGGMMLRNLVAVHAAGLGIDPSVSPGSSAWLALQWSLPQRAHGGAPPAGKLLLAHREAWQASRLDELDPRRLLLTERDPILRSVLALSLPGLADAEASAHVADGLAAASSGARHALASRLISMPGAARLNAAVGAQVAALCADVAVGRPVLETVRSGDARHEIWKQVEMLVARSGGALERAAAGNLLAALFVQGALASPQDAVAALEAWRATNARLRQGSAA